MKTRLLEKIKGFFKEQQEAMKKESVAKVDYEIHSCCKPDIKPEAATRGKARKKRHA